MKGIWRVEFRDRFGLRMGEKAEWSLDIAADSIEEAMARARKLAGEDDLDLDVSVLTKVDLLAGESE